jgi:hypothetical protein
MRAEGLDLRLLLEGLEKVGFEVVGGFEADGESDEVVVDAAAGALLG